MQSVNRHEKADAGQQQGGQAEAGRGIVWGLGVSGAGAWAMVVMIR
jgi:hypothetical protein